jgi:hypothetical protein
VQTTVVDPIGNAAPLGGAQDTLTAGAPPDVVAVPYCTGIDEPSGDVCGGGGAGQVIFGPSG